MDWAIHLRKVFPHGAVLLLNPRDGSEFKMNGHRLKKLKACLATKIHRAIQEIALIPLVGLSQTPRQSVTHRQIPRGGVNRYLTDHGLKFDSPSIDT